MGDLRLGETWSPLQRAKNGVIALLMRGALRGVDVLPERALLALGRFLGRVAHAASPQARALAVKHAARCFPPDDAGIVARRSFTNAGENLATCLLLRRTTTHALTRMEFSPSGKQAFEGALGEGRGLIFVSAHAGPFELLAAAIAELGLRPAIVVRESYDPRLDTLVDAHRVARGIEVIHRGVRGSGIRIVRALREGRPVGFLPDFGGRVPSLPASFLGRRAPFPEGPQRLAARLGTPVVVGTLRDSKHAEDVTRPRRHFTLDVERVPAASDIAELTQRVASVLERAILRSREDYPWFASPLGHSLTSTDM